MNFFSLLFPAKEVHSENAYVKIFGKLILSQVQVYFDVCVGRVCDFHLTEEWLHRQRTGVCN